MQKDGRAEASLVLRNGEADALQARMLENDAALAVDLQAFRSGRLGVRGSGAEGDLGRIGDVTALIDWIEGPVPGGSPAKGGAPQPCFQMESVLRDVGAARAANHVAHARHPDRLGNYGTGLQDWRKWTREQVWRGVAGCGVDAFSLLWRVAGLIAPGTLVARRTVVLCDVGWMDCFRYSVENTLPLIVPGGDNRSISLCEGFTRRCFHFQKVMGS